MDETEFCPRPGRRQFYQEELIHESGGHFKDKTPSLILYPHIHYYLGGALAEETGWRGYALPRLLRLKKRPDFQSDHRSDLGGLAFADLSDSGREFPHPIGSVGFSRIHGQDDIHIRDPDLVICQYKGKYFYLLFFSCAAQYGDFGDNHTL